MNLSDVTEAAADRVLEDLEEILGQAGEELDGELRERVRLLAVHAAEVGIRSTAGPAPELDELVEVLEARMVALEAAAAIVVAQSVRQSFRRVLVGAFEIALAGVL